MRAAPGEQHTEALHYVAVRRTNAVNTVLLVGGILGLTAAAAAAGSGGYGGGISLSGF